MTEVDLDYWIKDIKLGQIRGHLILTLFYLMDGKYQERAFLQCAHIGSQPIPRSSSYHLRFYLKK